MTHEMKADEPTSTDEPVSVASSSTPPLKNSFAVVTNGDVATSSKKYSASQCLVARWGQLREGGVAPVAVGT
jgi:hypothetical protein